MTRGQDVVAFEVGQESYTWWCTDLDAFFASKKTNGFQPYPAPFQKPPDPSAGPSSLRNDSADSLRCGLTTSASAELSYELDPLLPVSIDHPYELHLAVV